MAASQSFDKKIYTAGLLARDIGFLLLNSPEIIKAMQNKAISRAFIEKIILTEPGVKRMGNCDKLGSLVR